MTRLFAIVRTLIIGGAFVSLWVWFVPRWIAASKHAALHPDCWCATIPMAIGAIIVIRCAWDFAWTGRGTPAPFDPPRRLVVRGFYRWVRNPMYLGMGLILIGEGIMFPQITTEMLILSVVLWGLVTLFVIFYEEPTLRRLFGAEYEEYCRNVRRWLPRLKPYEPVR